jgi:CBS-domain-containing membrane protein
MLYTMKTTLLTFALLAATAVVLYAQPSLPSAPSQAPIDGGLSLVALAGGAYAYRKLKARK